MSENKEKVYPGIRQSLVIVVIVVFAVLIVLPLQLIGEDLFPKEVRMLLSYTLQMGVAFGIIWFIRKRITGQTGFNLKTGSNRLVVLSAIATLAALIALVIPLSEITLRVIPMSDTYKEIFSSLGDMRNWASFLTIVIAAPVLEELIFRGVMLDGLLKKYSPSTAIFVSSVCFALVHFNPWQFVTAMIIGVLIGWVYYHTRSLSLAIVMHLVNNLLVTLADFIYPSEELFESGFSLLDLYGGWLPLILITGFFLLLLVYCLLAMRKEFARLRGAGKM